MFVAAHDAAAGVVSVPVSGMSRGQRRGSGAWDRPVDAMDGRRSSAPDRCAPCPPAVLDGSELIHLGGGETVPCPGHRGDCRSPRLPVGWASGRRRWRCPRPRSHVLRDVKLCPGSRLVTTLGGRIVAESITTDMPGRVELCEEELRWRPDRARGHHRLVPLAVEAPVPHPRRPPARVPHCWRSRPCGGSGRSRSCTTDP